MNGTAFTPCSKKVSYAMSNSWSLRCTPLRCTQWGGLVLRRTSFAWLPFWEAWRNRASGDITSIITRLGCIRQQGRASPGLVVMSCTMLMYIIWGSIVHRSYSSGIYCHLQNRIYMYLSSEKLSNVTVASYRFGVTDHLQSFITII